MFSSVYQQIASKSANYNVQPGDDLVSVDASAGAVTITLPDPIGAYNQANERVGRVRVLKTDVTPNPVIIAVAGGGALVGISELRQRHQSVELISDGVGSWFSFGAIQNSFEGQVTLSSANILGMNGAPITLIPAPGAGRIIVVEDVLFKMLTTATAYASGGAVEFRYTNAAGAKVTADVAAAVVTAGGGPGTVFAKVLGVEASLTPVANAPVVITNATGAFTTGTGTAVVNLRFRIVTP